MIQVSNTTATNVLANGIIPFTNVDVQKGNSATLVGNAINLNNKGWYQVIANFSYTTTDAGVETIQMNINGNPVTRAVASETSTAGGTVNLTIIALVYVPGVCPYDGSDNTQVVTFTSNLVGTSTNATSVVTKIC